MPRRTYSTDGRSRALNALVPAATETYAPIPNSYFLSDIPALIDQKEGLTVVGQRCYTNSAGTQLVNFIDVSDARRVGGNNEICMTFAGRNSYDKSRSAALAVGATVIICGNGMFTGDMLTFKRKHTGSIAEELNVKVDVGINRMIDGFDQILREIERMKNFNISMRDKAEILGIMYFENNLVTPNQLSIIKEELKTSTHFRGNSLWDLYNNVTESLKRSHPSNHIEDHIRLHRFMSSISQVEETVEVEADVDYMEEPMEAREEDQPQTNDQIG